MPPITLAAGLLMVSRVRYAHMANKYLRGRRPWYMLFYFLLLLACFIVYPQLVLVVITLAYAATGPVGAVYRYFVPLPAGEGLMPETRLQDRSADGRRGEMFKQ